MLRRQLPWLCLALSSCVVSSFSIVDELPGDAGGSSNGGAAMTAGSSNGGASGSGGSDSPTAGKAQGGQNPQGGSAPEAGEGSLPDAGEPAIAEGGAAGAPAMPMTKPCDEENGLPPLLCDDFEKGLIDSAKWQPPPGISPESVVGPSGDTMAVRLSSVRLTSLLDDIQAGMETTVSFWVKILSPSQTQAGIMRFASLSDSDIYLKAIENELRWQSQNYTAPSQPPTMSFAPMQWYCVALHLTKSNMDINYVDATSDDVHTWVIDQQATQNIDDVWQNQPDTTSTIKGQRAFGGDATIASEILIDDVRIVRGKSNVCGIAL